MAAETADKLVASLVCCWAAHLVVHLVVLTVEQKVEQMVDQWAADLADWTVGKWVEWRQPLAVMTENVFNVQLASP